MKDEDREWEIVFEEFWAPIVSTADGELDILQVKKELCDYKTLMDNVTKVYEHIGGFSKPNTSPFFIIQAHDRAIDLAYSQGLEEGYEQGKLNG